MSVANLEKLVAENTYTFSSYEVRTCLKTITDLKQFVEQVTGEVTPRKKFSFKNKSTKKITTTQNDVVSEVPIRVENNSPNVDSNNSVFSVLDSPGFRGKENEVLVKEFNRGNNEEIREFVLSDLRGCDVRLMGSVRALFVHKPIDCKIKAGVYNLWDHLRKLTGNEEATDLERLLLMLLQVHQTNNSLFTVIPSYGVDI
ncbi:hypothetical protein K7X08_016962 [Anisodus acutangulus]|uniref:Tubulin-specific chaperone C N-terminal domain-containing protein n=1 Tax=Anisodus acutangulus TaxID=402998 RepID=A0A9Q1LQ31_9SOLA|nr:hypothetical protein K7X08_016962 [Anisodus acutangulus]